MMNYLEHYLVHSPFSISVSFWFQMPKARILGPLFFLFPESSKFIYISLLICLVFVSNLNKEILVISCLDYLISQLLISGNGVTMCSWSGMVCCEIYLFLLICAWPLSNSPKLLKYTQFIFQLYFISIIFVLLYVIFVSFVDYWSSYLKLILCTQSACASKIVISSLHAFA